MRIFPAQIAARRDLLAGVAYSVIAYFLFTVNDALVKWLVTTIPVVQILCLRSLVTMLLCIAVSGRVVVAKAISSPIRSRLLLRGVLVLIAWFCYYSAAPYLALGEMVTLYFASPVFVAMMAGRFLGERVTRWRWLAIIIGFAGVVAASQLHSLPHALPSSLILLAAFLWAINMLLYRKDIAAETSSVQIFSMNVVLFVVCGAASFQMATAMTVTQWWLLCLVGALGTTAQFMVLSGLKRMSASVAAPLEFSALIWSFLLGYLLWGEQPVPVVVLGAILITLSGILIVWEEWRTHRPVRDLSR